MSNPYDPYAPQPAQSSGYSTTPAQSAVQSAWGPTGFGTLIAAGMNVASTIAVTIAVVVAFIGLFDFDFEAFSDAAGSDGELTDAEIERLFDSASDTGFGTFLIVCLASMLVLFVVWVISILVVARFMKKRGVEKAGLVSFLGALAGGVVTVLGGLFVGPFILPVTYGAQWLVMGLMVQSQQKPPAALYGAGPYGAAQPAPYGGYPQQPAQPYAPPPAPAPEGDKSPPPPVAPPQ